MKKILRLLRLAADTVFRPPATTALPLRRALVMGAVGMFAPLRDSVSAVAQPAQKKTAPSKPSSVPVEPEVGSKHIVMNLQSGEMLLGNDERTPHPVASLAKLMAIYVVFQESLKPPVIKQTRGKRVRAKPHKPADYLNAMVTISKRVGDIREWDAGLLEGDTISRRELAIAANVHSANDAAVALAESVAGSEASFVERMNAAAVSLGMSGTRFITASGLPRYKTEKEKEEGVTTAHDMALLVRALITQFSQPEFRTILEATRFIGSRLPKNLETNPTSAIKNCIVPIDDGRYSYCRHDHVMGSPELASIGGRVRVAKTGTTDAAGFNMAAEATIKSVGSIIVVYLGGKDRTKRPKITINLIAAGMLKMLDAIKTAAGHSVSEATRPETSRAPAPVAEFTAR